MRDDFGYATRMLSAEELRRDYCDEREAAGAHVRAPKASASIRSSSPTA